MSERKFTPPTEFPAEYVDGHGNKVVILGRSKSHRTLVGFDVDGYACNYAENGAYYPDETYDAQDLHDIPKRITTWHNVYKDWVGPAALTRIEVDGEAMTGRLCVYRIERDEDGRNPEIFVEEVG